MQGLFSQKEAYDPVYPITSDIVLGLTRWNNMPKVGKTIL